MQSIRLFTLPLFGAFSFVNAHAAAGSIKLQTTAQQRQVTVDENGARHVAIVPAGHVLPGTEVIYTITYRNIGKQPAENVVVADRVPMHMIYVAGSATGDNADVSFSINGGKTWAGTPGQLAIDNGDGTTRSGTAKDITDIRWTIRGTLAPGANGAVSFRALLK